MFQGPESPALNLHSSALQIFLALLLHMQMSQSLLTTSAVATHPALVILSTSMTPAASSEPSIWVTVTQTLISSSDAFPMPLAEIWIRSEASVTPTCTHVGCQHHRRWYQFSWIQFNNLFNIFYSFWLFWVSTSISVTLCFSRKIHLHAFYNRHINS